MKPRAREPLHSQTGKARARVIENEWPGSEPFGCNARRATPMRRHKGHHWVAPPRRYHESGYGRLRQCDQPDVQPSVRQPGQCFRRSEHGHLDVDSGMVLAQHVKRLRQQVSDCASRSADPRAPFKPLHLTLNIIERLLRISKQSTRALHQHLSYRRRPYLSALPRKERCPDALFEFGDMKADGRRRQIQRARCIGK